MKYVIFDLEWNQCAVESEYVSDPVCLTGEIIEIGAVRLNEKFEKEDEIRLYIRPMYYKKLHRQVASLTGIHDRDLSQNGIPFPEAYEKFCKWCGDEYSYMTWSMSDLPVLLQNMMLHHIDCSDLPDVYDLQRMFCHEIMRCERRISLDDALKVLGEKGDTAHDALNDSRNTVLVCNHLDISEYADEYVTRPFALMKNFGEYSSRKELWEDPILRDAQCPYCGEKLEMEPWIQLSNWQAAAMGTCCEGDEFLMLMGIHNISNVRMSPFCILYEMNDDLWDIYCAHKTENP